MSGIDNGERAEVERVELTDLIDTHAYGPDGLALSAADAILAAGYSRTAHDTVLAQLAEAAEDKVIDEICDRLRRYRSEADEALENDDLIFEADHAYPIFELVLAALTEGATHE